MTITTDGGLSKASLLVATDLRKAEHSLQVAQRDLLTFMLTATEANIDLKLAPGTIQPMMAPAAAALAAIAGGQGLLGNDAHRQALKLARSLRLTETDYGGSDPKPSSEFFIGAEATTTVMA